MDSRLNGGRIALAIVAIIGLVVAMMAVFAGTQAQANGGGSNPEGECAGEDPLWNGEYWKLQIDDGVAGAIETNVGNGAISYTLNGNIVWTNQHSNSVFRVVFKTGGGAFDKTETGLWATGEGDTFSLPDKLSHITFCFTDEAPPPESGKIIVEKEVTAGSDTAQSFVFTASYDGDGFSLSHGQSNDSGDLSAGTYSVSETVPAGWTLQSATCDDQSNPWSISLQEGETVTCTFVNHEIPDEINPGKIIVKKEVTAGSDTAQSFVFTPSGFTLDDNTLADGEMGMSDDVEPGGEYSVSESVPAGWTLQSATCDDTNSTPGDINVEEGETVTCTFVNHIPDEVSPTSIVNTTTTIVSTTTTIVSTTVEVSDETLPFTGFENGTTGLLALILVASGALALVGARVFREETDE